MTTTKLTRDGNGGYITADSRWTVRPRTMGSGTTGWAGGKGWSQGRREWQITDTTGQARMAGDRSTRIVRTLDDARDLIEAHS